MKKQKNTTSSPNHTALPLLTREQFHRVYGGLIYISDFNTDYHPHKRSKCQNTGSPIAMRIASDLKGGNFPC